MVLLQTRCPFTSLVISNIETTFLPWSRFSLGSWSSCLRMYSQSFLVSSVRGSGSLPTTAASAASGCTGLLRAFLGEAAFFGVGIGQLERAGPGSQAKNQPCFQRFAGAPRRISTDSCSERPLERPCAGFVLIDDGKARGGWGRGAKISSA